MANSYKFVNGKLVQRSDEEQARLDQLKAARAAREPVRKRIPRAREPFVMLTLSQAEKLLPLKPVCWPLFMVLLFENFRARGQPFALPAHGFNTVKGLTSRPALWRALVQLEAAGLIAIKRVPPLPPLIHCFTGETVSRSTVSPVKQ